MEKSFISIILW